MRAITNFFKKLNPPHVPFKVTDENLEEIRVLHPNLLIFLRKKCPICQSYVVCNTRHRKLNDPPSITAPIGYCPNCRAVTVDDPWVPDNENPLIEVMPYQPNWVRCPHCGVRFSILSQTSWTGERHSSGSTAMPIAIG